MSSLCEKNDLLVFSHLRWDFVFQRPQHLLTRFAPHRRVYYFEEPEFQAISESHWHRRDTKEGVIVIVPYLPQDLSESQRNLELKKIVNDVLLEEMIDDYTVWYYTPMALAFTEHLEPAATIFDCMDELSHFKFAPPELLMREQELLERADVVYTGGHSLFEAKRHRHRNIHPFPSSIDYAHFATARRRLPEPTDQMHIPHPRAGFFGVIDERMDLDLVRHTAELRPDWQFVFVGPVVKIDPKTLPQLPNIHYLGKKSYEDLPLYLAHWDVAIMPFALNDATKFISPTKTPEYLAAGRPVVSTSVRDVVRPYGDEALVHIADTADEFAGSLNRALHQRMHDSEWLLRVDEFLSGTSWNNTWLRMAALERAVLKDKRKPVETELFMRPAAASSASAYL